MDDRITGLTKFANTTPVYALFQPGPRWSLLYWLRYLRARWQLRQLRKQTNA